MRRSNLMLLAVTTSALFFACPPTYPKCESDDHCKEKGEVCVQGQCLECATDANCKDGFVCDANKCVPKPECTGDSGCGKGMKCSKGKCAVIVSNGPTCTFEAVHFEFNEFGLTSEVQSTLSQYADCIKKQNLKFTLEGNADERGTEEANMVLSQKRAASVRKYLVDLGVAGGALDTVGFGENNPKVNGSGEAAWAANRRVDFKKR